jgi:transposase
MNPERTSILLSTIIFDEGLYPRVEGHDPCVVQSYARDMEQIEAAGKYLSVNADNVLLDGRHRMLAYKKRADGRMDLEVPVFRYNISSPLESFRMACRLQDRGKSLSNDDRVACAKRLYALGDQSQHEIAEALGVSQATVSTWLSRTIKEEKERKKEAAYALWLACHTQPEIADRINVPQQTVAEWVKGFTELSAADISVFSADFTPPIYNVWKQQTKSGGPDHFGNSEPRWLDNLLYLYTESGSVVVDPFAGSGSTIDVCRKRKRRFFVSDRKPIVEREHEIRRHDLTDGLPKPPRWKDVKLVYLDPPYWKQAEGQYSNDPADLANMPLEQFHNTLAGIIDGFAKKLSDAYIALIIQPTQWKSPERQFTDHVAEMIRRVRLPIEMRFSVPYESQQCTAQMVEWAKANKRCLVLTREIVVWRV